MTEPVACVASDAAKRYDYDVSIAASRVCNERRYWL